MKIPEQGKLTVSTVAAVEIQKEIGPQTEELSSTCLALNIFVQGALAGGRVL